MLQTATSPRLPIRSSFAAPADTNPPTAGQTSATPSVTGRCCRAARSADVCTVCGRPHEAAAWIAMPQPCRRCTGTLARAAEWAAASDARRREIAVGRCGVPETYCRGGRLPDYTTGPLAVVLAGRPRPKGGLYIVGDCGSGKTALAAARTVDAASRGWRARFAYWPNVVARVLATYDRRGGESAADIIGELIEADYLAVDDVGAGLNGQAASAHEARLLELLSNGRAERGAGDCTTDVTSNLLPQEIATAYNAPIARRIGELTTVYVLVTL